MGSNGRPIGLSCPTPRIRSRQDASNVSGGIFGKERIWLMARNISSLVIDSLRHQAKDIAGRGLCWISRMLLDILNLSGMHITYRVCT